MRFRIGYVATDPITMMYTHAANSYDAFREAVRLIDDNAAFECIVYIADGDEWVKLANVRKQ